WTRATEYESSCRSLLFRLSRCARRCTSSTFDAEHRDAYLFSWYGSTAMKPAPFQYVSVASVDAGVDALAEHAPAARIIAGGQRLVPMMKVRLARPAALIDINRVEGLSSIRRRNGSLYVGAATRQSELENSRIAAAYWPLLRMALHHVANPQI